MKTATTPDEQMRALKEWAIDRMTTGTQTPWAWFQFMKLLEVLDTFIEAGDEVETTTPPKRREPKRAPRQKSFPENVVPIDVRRRALD